MAMPALTRTSVCSKMAYFKRVVAQCKGTATVRLALDLCTHRGQNSKQINNAKYLSKFLVCSAKMLDKYVKSQKKKFFVHCPFLQSQAK